MTNLSTEKQIFRRGKDVAYVGRNIDEKQTRTHKNIQRQTQMITDRHTCRRTGCCIYNYILRGFLFQLRPLNRWWSPVPLLIPAPLNIRSQELLHRLPKCIAHSQLSLTMSTSSRGWIDPNDDDDDDDGFDEYGTKITRRCWPDFHIHVGSLCKSFHNRIHWRLAHWPHTQGQVIWYLWCAMI